MFEYKNIKQYIIFKLENFASLKAIRYVNFHYTSLERYSFFFFGILFQVVQK